MQQAVVVVVVVPFFFPKAGGKVGFEDFLRVARLLQDSRGPAKQLFLV
jgi:hypothetical protein